MRVSTTDDGTGLSTLSTTRATTTDAPATLLPPIEHPKSLGWRIAFSFMRRKFGKVMTPASVWSVRMPLAFTTHYGKVGKLDKKLKLPADTAILEQVATVNGCAFCMDAGRAAALKKSRENEAKFDALGDYRTSALFSEGEPAALDYVTELTQRKIVDDATFARLTSHYSEREICDIVWLVASEHLFNLNNIGLNIGSDGFCAMVAER